MAHAYGIDNDNGFINRIKYSSLGHNIIASNYNIVAVKCYKRNPENFLVKILPKSFILKTSGLDYEKLPNDLPNWIKAFIDTKLQIITIETIDIKETNIGDYAII